ncbi:hypothetical protein AGDE_05033 [Angomonas deanei]|nr:hypothetical protein AGDE_05033 [Angomonas deanei]|eukprot:EPY38896.1 hypothetical protein AGDE_05033 [Angomonas deanei]
MFATKTERAPLETKDTPGPGTYNLAPKGRTIPREAFSAFGSTSSRFNPQYDETPGPGSYTGEIAPRRVKPQYGKGTAPFVSNSDRFSSKNGGPPGPGAYDGSLLPTHVPFGANTPFHSTVPRFGPVSNRALPLKFDEYAFEDTDPALYPRQKYISKRPFVNREIQPTLGPEILPERSYNINYDGYRPEGSTRGTLGHAPRMGGGASQRQAYSAPGPGTYDPRGATSYRHANSNWSQDPRFKVAGQPIGGDDIGRTYYESTFLTKSHNVTIGSDTMWMRN